MDVIYCKWDQLMWRLVAFTQVSHSIELSDTVLRERFTDWRGWHGLLSPNDCSSHHLYDGGKQKAEAINIQDIPWHKTYRWTAMWRQNGILGFHCIYFSKIILNSNTNSQFITCTFCIFTFSVINIYYQQLIEQSTQSSSFHGIINLVSMAKVLGFLDKKI